MSLSLSFSHVLGAHPVGKLGVTGPHLLVQSDAASVFFDGFAFSIQKMLHILVDVNHFNFTVHRFFSFWYIDGSFQRDIIYYFYINYYTIKIYIIIISSRVFWYIWFYCALTLPTNHSQFSL